MSGAAALRSRRPRAGRVAPGLLVLLVAVATACGEPPPRPEELPVPDLAALDVPVRERYRELRSALDAAVAAGEPAEQAEAWGAVGNWYLAHDAYDGARIAYRGARALAPEDPRWPYYLGHVARQTGDLEAALEHFASALELAPERTAPRIWRAELLFELGRLDAADAELRSVLERSPGAARALAGRGRIALARGDAEAAIELLTAALERQPEASDARYALGSAYRQLGDLERAEAALARVPADNRLHVAMRMDDPWLAAVERLRREGHEHHQNRGQRAVAEGRYHEAAEAFQAAIAADPTSIDARLNLVLAWKRAGDLEAAEAAARDAVAVAPGFARARVVLAELLLKTGRPAAARRELEAAAAADPDDEVARFNLALLLLGEDRPAAAGEHFRAARRLMAESVPARQGHAVALFAAGDATAAVRALEEDVRQLPEERFLALLLARFLAADPQSGPAGRERALEIATRLVTDEGATVSTAETVAMALAALGRWPQATAWQEAAVGALPESAPAASRELARHRLTRYSRRQPADVPWAGGESLLALPVEEPRPR